MLKKNQTVTVTIEDMGSDGAGIGKLEGYPIFIKDAVIGDVVEARIIKPGKSYAYGKLERIVTPSSFRVQPECACFKQCGGCQLQPLSYEKQLEFKEKKVRNNLVRIGKFSESHIRDISDPVISMEEPFHYRNKAQFPFGTDREGNVITGFYAGRTHVIVPNTDCALGEAVNQHILETILAYMKECHVTAYNEETGRGLVRHALIRAGHFTGEIMVCLVINGTKLPKEQRLVEQLIRIEGMTSISVSRNTEKTNVIMGKEIRTLWGKDTITDTIGEICFQISPLSFFQVNSLQTEKLYERALEYADLEGEEIVWDLYCGIGTISLFLSKKAKQVYGVEIVQAAVEDARRNAARNHITNVEFYVGKAEEVLPQKYEEEHLYADVVVVDPPRKGCDAKCLETILAMKPKRIVYVSCDSATLARDLKILCETDYELVKAGVVDQFPQTVHVECVVLMSKVKE